MKLLNKIKTFFAKNTINSIMLYTKETVYKPINNIIDSSVLDDSEIELEETKKEKKKIGSKTVSEKDRYLLAELNTDAIINIKKIFNK